MHTTSITLLDRLRAPGNQAAWDRFVELYTPLFFHWARKCGLRSDDAADLVQDAFVALLQKLPTFRYDDGKSFRAWLYTLVLNLWRDRQRAVAARRQAAGSERVGEVAVPDPVVALESAEFRAHLVRRALHLMQRDFEPTTWRAVWEHVVNGKPAPKVAAELGLTVAAVYCAKFRVLNRLREEFRGLLD